MKERYVFGIGELLFDLLPDGKHLGGAPVNFAFHLFRCGFRAYPVSAVGRDDNGDELLRAVGGKGLPTDGISRNDLPSGTAGVRILGDGNMFFISEPAAWDRIVPSDDLLGKAGFASAVCFGTLAQRGEWNRNAIRSFLRHIPDAALRIFDVNFRQEYFSETVLLDSLPLCNVLKVSEEEYPVLEKSLRLSGTATDALGRLAEKYRLRSVLFTRGENGASVFSGGLWRHRKAEFCPCVADTVGCGDGFTSFWTAAVLNGKDDAEALEIAGKAASFIAGKSGAMPEMPEEIIRLLK